MYIPCGHFSFTVLILTRDVLLFNGQVVFARGSAVLVPTTDVPVSRRTATSTCGRRQLWLECVKPLMRQQNGAMKGRMQSESTPNRSHAQEQKVGNETLLGYHRGSRAQFSPSSPSLSRTRRGGAVRTAQLPNRCGGVGSP